MHKDFVPEGQTVNAEYYEVITDRLLKHINRVRPAVFLLSTIFLVAR
jgi:hypothetical protein